MKSTGPNRVSLFVIAIPVVVILAAAGGGLMYYHEQPRFCSDMCHVMEPYHESWVSPGLGANVHAQADVECLDCHEATIEDQITELVANVTGDFKVPLRERKLPKEKCLSCHEHDSYAELGEITADQEHNPHASHNGELECSLCHNMHRPSELYCAQCHDTAVLEIPEGWAVSETQ